MDVPGYVLEVLLTQDRDGALWRGRVTGDGDPVAVRVLPPGAWGEAVVLDAVRARVETLAGVRSCSLVLPRNVVALPVGAAAVVLDPLPSWRPASVLADAAVARAAVAGLVEALAQVHGVGVVHGQITPAQVSVASDGAAVLTGFELAPARPGGGRGRPGPPPPSASGDLRALARVMAARYRPPPSAAPDSLDELLRRVIAGEINDAAALLAELTAPSPPPGGATRALPGTLAPPPPPPPPDPPRPERSWSEARPAVSAPAVPAPAASAPAASAPAASAPAPRATAPRATALRAPAALPGRPHAVGRRALLLAGPVIVASVLAWVYRPPHPAPPWPSARLGTTRPTDAGAVADLVTAASWAVRLQWWDATRAAAFARGDAPGLASIYAAGAPTAAADLAALRRLRAGGQRVRGLRHRFSDVQLLRATADEVELGVRDRLVRESWSGSGVEAPAGPDGGALGSLLITARRRPGCSGCPWLIYQVVAP